MYDLYKVAYIDVQPPDMQLYQADSVFARNIPVDQKKATSIDKRNFISREEFWIVNIISVFQPEYEDDHDPNFPIESGELGATPGTDLPRRYGVLLFHESIRDYCHAVGLEKSFVERYIVVHETGHQFVLRHIDGRWPNALDVNPADDYIMTDIWFPNTIIAPNIEFGPICRAKLRATKYPCPDSD